MSEYRKFISRRNAAPQRTLASLATLAELIPVSGPCLNADKTRPDPPKTQSGSAKPAKVAKVSRRVCVVCSAPDDLWTLDTPTGPIAVHPECAEFLLKPEAQPTAAYHGVTAEPDGSACRVTIVELPAVGLRYRRTFAHLQLKPPDHIPVNHWRQCIEDGRAFLHQWGDQAQALGWTSADLFGLIEVPERPSPSFNRLSRYDATGLCWLLEGREVVALTEATAKIRNPATGSVTTYRRFNKPSYGPLGDSLEGLK